ncbi:MAG: hypothetical protein A2V88_14160 [Elusimicrobia bacterium RBG_16_66_12]|nr:MAG: hypothetical protein A2V88_14160 [Elusimicrobia bacterium RBG_16_66_12]
MKTSPATDLWNQAVERLRAEIGEENSELWLKPVEAMSLEDGVLLLKAPNKFFSDGIKERHQKRLLCLLREISGSDVGIDFHIERDLTRVLPPSDPVPEASPQSDFTLSDLNPRYTFETFVIGESNRLARAAAESIAKSPGTQYNPYVIYGGVGLGKTHLMHAIGNAMRRQHPKARVLYTTSEQFVNEYIGAVQNNGLETFRARYRCLDCLLIDDIQFLIAKERSEQEFFHTFNALFDSRKQIVVSSDRSPKELSPLEQRLVSRLEWGFMADIKAPDLETRIAILRKKAEIEQFSVPDDVILYVASSVKTNVRSLEGSLIRLKAFQSMTGSPLSIDEAREILKDTITADDSNPVRIETVQRIVALKYSVDVKDLKGHQRTASISLPRQVAMYLSCEMTEQSSTDIGRAFGGKDHSTVLHARKKIGKKVEEDPFFLELINKLKSDIRTAER